MIFLSVDANMGERLNEQVGLANCCEQAGQRKGFGESL